MNSSRTALILTVQIIDHTSKAWCVGANKSLILKTVGCQSAGLQLERSLKWKWSDVLDVWGLCQLIYGWFCYLLSSYSPLLLLHLRAILQSWITRSSATSSLRPWRTKGMCCSATCRRYMNFTTGGWNVFCSPSCHISHRVSETLISAANIIPLSRCKLQVPQKWSHRDKLPLDGSVFT